MKKSNKVLTKNYIYNLSYQLLTILLPIITTPYISRVLGAENIGIYSYVMSITMYFILFGTLGTTIYGQREIAYVQNNEKNRSKVFFEILIIRFIALLLAIVIYYLLFIFNKNNNLIYILFIIEIIANMLDITWFFQGMEEFKKIVIRNFIIKIVSIISIFIFVKGKNGIYIYTIIYVLSLLISNISLWLYIPKYICKVPIKKLKITKKIKPILELFIPQIAIQIYTILDKTMLGLILNDMSEVGYYEQALKISKIGLTVIAAFSTVMIPQIAKAASEDNKKLIEEKLLKSFQFVLIFGIAISFGLIGIIKNLIPWFLGDGYDKVASLTIILGCLVVIIGLNNVTGNQYLIQTRNQKKYTISVVVGALVNFILNILTIKKLGALGAAISTVLAESIILIIQMSYMSKNTNIKMKNIFAMAINYIISGIIMLLFEILIGMNMDSTMFTTLIQIFTGALLYFSILLILKDKVVVSIYKILLNKIKYKNINFLKK